jgi:hypothetical protein
VDLSAEKLKLVTLSGKHQENLVQKLFMTFAVPQTRVRTFDAPDLEYELTRAIQVVGSALKSIATLEDGFDLQEGKVTLEFGVTDSGAFEFSLLGAKLDAKAERVQRLTLTVSSKDLV